MPADDASPSVTLTGPAFTGGVQFDWSPDGNAILAVQWDSNVPWLLDPAGGQGKRLTWTIASPDSIEWQRLAPVGRRNGRQHEKRAAEPRPQLPLGSAGSRSGRRTANRQWHTATMSENIWLILGAGAALVAVVFALGLGVPAVRPPGARGLIVRWGHAFVWLTPALALLTLGLGPPVDALASPLGLAALVSYVIFLGTLASARPR